MFEKYRYCADRCSSSMDLLSYLNKDNDKNKTIALASSLIILTSLITVTPINYPVHAETGKGNDIFRVILTIFGVEESKGDVFAIVTAKNEAAKVKLFDASGPETIPLNASQGGNFIEYVATFPNVTVNSGDEYRACIATVKDLELICKIGNNSPAARPEFMDLSLNASGSSDAEQATLEESDNGDEIEEGDRLP